MAIYSRGGSAVTIKRPITSIVEVAELEKRRPDKHDKERLALNQYAVVEYADDGREVMADLAMLLADEGIREIHTAARAVGCKV